MGYEGYGARIRAIRKSKGITIKELADQCGYTAQWLSYIETHGDKGTIDSVRKISKSLGVSPGDLLCDTAEPRKQRQDVKVPLRNSLRGVMALLADAEEKAAAGLEISACERITSAIAHIDIALQSLEPEGTHERREA